MTNSNECFDLVSGYWAEDLLGERMVSRYQVLRNQEELNAFEVFEKKSLLESETLLLWSFRKLEDVNSNEDIECRVEWSLKAMDFIADVLVAKGSSLNGLAIEKAKKFLTTISLEAAACSEFRQALAVDKAELYLLLKYVIPQETQEIKTASKGTRLFKIIHYAENHM